MAKKSNVEFEGFEEVVARLTALEGDVKGITEEALRQTRKVINSKLEVAMRPHNQTNRTIKSLAKEKAEWVGTTAEQPVGFHISKGGLASIFLMYGTPRMDKDQKLYNAIYGNATRKEVQQVQEEIFYNEIRRLEG